MDKTPACFPRRDFLRAIMAGAAGLSGLFLSGRGHALGETSRFHIALLRHPGNWNPRPGAVGALLEEIRSITSIDARLTRQYVSLNDPRMFNYPFVLLQSDAELPRLGRAEGNQLKRFLELGGFMLVDNVGQTSPSAAMDRSLKQELARLFPGRALERIPAEHVIYRSFYRLDGPSGRLDARPHLEGLELDGRYALVYSQNDLSGAWARDQFGAWRYDLIPGTRDQRENAFRLGVNLAMYALCLDYKDDHVHLDYLLKRRQWRITPPSSDSSGHRRRRTR